MLHSKWGLLRSVVALGLACLPALASAEEMATMRVERTPAYEVVLSIDAPIAGDAGMGMSSGHATDMAMSHDSSMMMHQSDQGMAVNHWLDVHVTQADSGAVVSDLAPTLRIADKSTGEARDLPGVMGVNGGVSSTDFHYGQNVFLPDGTYEVTIQLGPGDTAVFRDVTVSASTMMGH